MAWKGFSSAEFVSGTAGKNYLANANTDQANAHRTVKKIEALPQAVQNEPEVKAAKEEAKKTVERADKVIKELSAQDKAMAKHRAAQAKLKEEGGTKEKKKENKKEESNANEEVKKADANVEKAVDQYSDEFDARSEAAGLTDKHFQEYILNNPDLREHSEALGLYGADAADWGRWHFYTFGQNEARVNTPGEVKDLSLRTQKWAQTEIPQVYKDIGEKYGIPMNTLNDVFRYSVRSMTPSQLWETRAGIAPEWNLAGREGLLGEEGFDPTGWRYEADRPYAEGLLGDTLGLNKDLPGGKPIGQLVDEEDLRFIQDRFNDAFIAGDFPEGWIDQNKKWQGPEGLEGYWNILTNAYRDEAGDLRTSVDRPPEGWFGYQPLTGLGPRGQINRGGQPFNQTGVPTYGPGSRGLGGSGEYLATPYTRPDLQNWSHLAPPEGPGLLGTAPAQRALLANNLANYQPQAQGGVMEYAPRGGSAWAPRTYSTTGPPRLPATTATPDTGVGGGIIPGISDFTQHDEMYPDHRQQAADRGLVWGTPAYNDWIAATKQGMINQGMDISGNQFGGDRYTSGDWIRYQNLLSNQAAPVGTREVFGQDAYDFSAPPLNIFNANNADAADPFTRGN